MSEKSGFPSLQLASAPNREPAEQALEMAHRDPRRAEVLGRAALAEAMSSGDREAAAIAERALGLVAREHHDLAASARHLRRAVRQAEGAGLPTLAAQGRVSLAGTLGLQGNWVGALREADRAAAALRGVDLARLHAQRAWILMAKGDLHRALEGFRTALPPLRRSGDRVWEARVYTNRALARYHLGDLAAAEGDLRRARQIYRDVGETRMAATASQNLGMVLGMRGDVPGALACFEEAEEHFRTWGVIDAMGLNDRSQVLLTAGLVQEARRCATVALEVLTREGRQSYAAVAALKLAEAALLDGDPQGARESAEHARHSFRHQRRWSLAALALHVSVQAAWTAGERTPALLRTARRAATDLGDAGFRLAALDAHLVAAQLAVHLDRHALARRELAGAAQARRGGTVQLRVRAWHAEALLRLAEGNRRGANRALEAGMRQVERYRLALGATELRAHASGHVAELARLGLGLAIEDGRPERVLAWAERWRAGALRLRPVRPPDDRRLAADLAALRSVAAEIDTLASAGRPTASLMARQMALEQQVRDRARLSKGIFAASLESRLDVGALAQALGDQALVEIVEHAGAFHAVVLAGGRISLYSLGPCHEVSAEQERLRFSLKSLAWGRGSTTAQAAAGDGVRFGAKRLDDLLMAPLAVAVDDRPLVVVPTGGLHVLPWSTLPSCHRRPLTVAPSAAVWHRTATARQSGENVVLVAGPGLDHAAAEVAALARRYPGAVRLSGARATCGNVCAALDGARLAHIAAHGRFRADNPLFSSLELADGPTTVYDLESLGQPPDTVVLSACESGLSDVRPGDELMGLAAALFALGTRTLVASSLAVSDEATRRLMLAFYANLRVGSSPMEALARAQAAAAAAGGADLAAAAAFTCLGAGR